jgi:hypothetical protein
MKDSDRICTHFRNELTYPSSNFIVEGIASATSNVCPNDDETKDPFVIDETFWK